MTFWQRGEESNYRQGQILNMSTDGVFVETTDPLPPPTIIEMQLLVGDEPVQVRGEVIRSMGGSQFASAGAASGMGVRFCEPEDETVQFLTSHGLNP